MIRSERLRAAVAVLTAATGLAVASCGGASSDGSNGSTLLAMPQKRGGSGTGSPIAHIVVVVQENRSFDDLFATFPGADGATQGLMKTPSGDVYVPLKEVKLRELCDFGHGYDGFLRNLDGGKMDGFGLASSKCNGNTTAAYQYVNPMQIAAYWTLAQRYVLADHMFQTQGSGSFTAHQDLIAGGTTINPLETKSLVDYPTVSPWGCDAPKGTRTSLLVWNGKHIGFKYNVGPYPCLKYETIRDLLDAKAVSWKYYSPPVLGSTGALWNAFDAIKAVRYGPEWGTNVTDSDTEIFNDITYNQLPAVSWVIPDAQNSDHPGGQKTAKDTGPSWVASIVNAIGESSYWPNTAIIITWDDWGGFYDNVQPPLVDNWGGLGFRVPMIVVSAFAPQGQSSQSYVSHTQYEFGSILKLMEQTFDLGTLGKTDERANSMLDCFDFTQTPHPFESVPSTYSKEYFLHQRPSYQPVDTE